MDKTEFAARVESVRQRLYRTAYLYLGSEADALEAVDEAVYQALRALKKLRQPEYFETWLTRILLNQCHKELRRRKTVFGRRAAAGPPPSGRRIPPCPWAPSFLFPSIRVCRGGFCLREKKISAKNQRGAKKVPARACTWTGHHCPWPTAARAAFAVQRRGGSAEAGSARRSV